jgi:glycosyltransferase involved in cell wall biosynthesis
MPKISVILPTFNRAQSLRRAIASVLTQGYRNFELIIIDDGSTDATAQVIAEFNSEGVRTIAGSTNRGANWARNQGVAQARGEIVCFLDSDDEYRPEKLAYVADYFERRPDIDLLLDSHVLHLSRSGSLERRRRDNPVIEDTTAFRSALFYGKLFKATPAVSVRRSALLDVGLFDESLDRAEDLDVVLRIARDHRCAATDAVLWIKHPSADSISGDPDTYVSMLIDICERHPEYYINPSYRRRLRQYLARHFLTLVQLRAWRMLRRDLHRAKSYERFDLSVSRLWIWIAKQTLEYRYKRIKVSPLASRVRSAGGTMGGR